MYLASAGHSVNFMQVNGSSTYGPTVFGGSGQVTTTAPYLFSGFHVLGFVCGVAGSSVDHFYVDGTEVPSYGLQGSSCSYQSSGNLYLGSSNVAPWASSGFEGTFYRLVLYPTQLTTAQMALASAQISNEVSGRGVGTHPVPLRTAAPQMMFIGDSITAGLGVTTGWPGLLSLTNQPTYNNTTWAIPGSTISSMLSSEPNRAAPGCGAYTTPAVALVFAGTNDFEGFDLISGTNATPGSVFNMLAGEVQTLKRAGCRVFVGTMLSRTGTDNGGGSYDTDKDNYDALILGGWKAIGADGVIDFAANPLLGADGANAGTYFQADHVHPIQAGQQILGDEASNALNYYFGYNDQNPHVVTALPYSMAAGDGTVSLAGVTGAGTLTLPDCTGQSGAVYRISNPQAAFAVTVAPLNASQLINGLAFGTAVTVPANGTLTLRDVPNAKTVSGCHWEM